VSDSIANCEFEILTPHSYFPLSTRTGLIFQSSSGGTVESPTDSQVSSGLFSRTSTSSTQCTELSLEQPQKVFIKTSDGPPPEPRAPIQPQLRMPLDHLRVPEIYPNPDQRRKSQEVTVTPKPSKKPRPESWAPTRRSDEELYPHLNQTFAPPPSQLPQKPRKDFKYFKSKLREFFHFKR
jgi:hypothetical protein